MENKNPRISVVIPYMESSPEMPSILKRCTDSLKENTETIIVWNSGMGYAKPVNKGLALAKGDYLIVMNDDIYFTKGDLTMLCDPKAVTSPTINGVHQPFWGACFCIPRWVYEKIGGLSEGFNLVYFEDDDYIFTLEENGIPMRGIPEVNAEHPEGGKTVHTLPNWQELFAENRSRFLRKWGRLP